MKKILSAILTVLVVMNCIFVFASCGNEKGTTTTVENTTLPGKPTENVAPAESDYAYIKSKGKLVIGVTEYKPMDYKDEKGEWTGFDVEYANAVAEKLGLETEFLVIDWDNKVFELEAKKIDLVWNGMTITDKLKKGMDITEPYAKNAQIVVMNADKVDEYKTVESLKPLKFAVEVASAGKEVAEKNGYVFVELDTQAAAVLEVSTGKADACIIDLAMANAMVGEGSSYENLAQSLSLQQEEFGIGCRKGSDMREKINMITKELIADGSLPDIAKKYDIVLVD